jgi:hypothetical protein
VAVADRIKEAIDKMNMGEPENGLIQVCIAVDATAKKEYPKSGPGERTKKFLRDNQVFLTAFLRLAVGEEILLQVENRDGKPETKRLEEVLYRLVRCALVHEAELSDRVTITNQACFGLSNDGKFILSYGLIWGMICAVIGSPKNTQERAPENYWISIRGRKILLNELWGKKDIMIQDMFMD